MKVVILCGGRGTRLNGERPKPLMEIGGRPIVSHVIAIYAAQGFRHFLLLTGYGGEAVAEWASDDPRVECVDTGLDTPTGGRVRAVRERLGEPFCLTYADGVADIDLGALRGRHAQSGALATMTVVRPELPFGVAMVQDGRVVGFREKPRAEQWVNGGFFVMEPAALRYLGPDAVLEREPLERLAADGALAAYRHTGFWRCLDTAKDAVALEEACAGGAPWLRGRTAAG
ncbi:MAG TPA: NTP transferase domain-containing protein [Solirubrobacteraceae bacterium]|nr:NTP transferase domain-containing protein [Solirubrobacteraceae bacterium]